MTLIYWMDYTPDDRYPATCVDVDLPFETVVSAFSPETVADNGWPIFPFNGKRIAINPGHVDQIVEVSSDD